MHNETVPLKGHVKLIIEDVRDGSQKVEEGHNLITNAVASVLEDNWCGLANFTSASIFPLKNLYGGCMLFQNAITPSAGNYNPPSELTNPLVAHAGNIAPESDWTGKKRGTPVPSEYLEDDTSIKQVWLWDNTQGNAPQISTVCLCPQNMGNYGLTPTQARQYTSRYTIQSTLPRITSYSRALCMQNPFSIDDDGKTGKAIYLSGTTFEEITVRHDWLAFGIMRNATAWQEVSSRTATVRTAQDKTNIFEDEDYYYVYTITGADDIRIDRVSKTDMTVTQMDMVDIGGVSLYTGEYYNQPMQRMTALFGYDGRYLYLPNSAGNGFVAINPNDSTDKLVIDGTVNLYLNRADIGWDNVCKHNALVISEGLIFGDYYIINGASVYAKTPTLSPLQDADGRKRGSLYRHGASAYAVSNSNQNYNFYHGVLLVPFFLSTIYPLESPAHKTTSQTMRLEYTIEENT
jgi:hypothetical protein